MSALEATLHVSILGCLLHVQDDALFGRRHGSLAVMRKGGLHLVAIHCDRCQSSSRSKLEKMPIVVVMLLGDGAAKVRLGSVAVCGGEVTVCVS